MLCPPTARTVRCSKCTKYVKHHKRKISEWMESAKDPADIADQTILSPRKKTPRTSLWQTPAEVTDEVRILYASLQGAELEQQLSRVAKHLAIESVLFHAVNPIAISPQLILCFCPNCGYESSTTKCQLYSIKQQRTNNTLFCLCCAKRNKYHHKEDNESPTSPTIPLLSPTTTASTTSSIPDSAGAAALVSTDAQSKTNLAFLSREELELRYRRKAINVKQLQRAIARLHARKQLQCISDAATDTHDVSAVQPHVRKTTSAVVDLLSTKKGEKQMRAMLLEVLTNDMEV